MILADKKVVFEKNNHRNTLGVLGALVLFGAVELYRWINPDKQEMQMIASLIGFWGLLLLCRLAFTEKALARVRFWAGGSGIILGMSTLMAITTKLSASNNSIDLFLKSLPVILQLPAALICMVVMMAGLVIGLCSVLMLVVCILNSLFVSDDNMFSS
ncbi:MAG: hypothetical protein NTV02_03295 [Candidatus Zambryskibacteria bacterium]|nr:hypothetical protein [Candidatus Zambryskibacteria bacterium]